MYPFETVSGEPLEEAMEKAFDRLQKMWDVCKNLGDRGVHIVTRYQVSEGDIKELPLPSGEIISVKVIWVLPSEGITEEGEVIPVWEWLGAEIDPDATMSREEFEELYSEETEETVESESVEAEAAVEEDLNICPSCGANRHDCEKNQQYFGVHLERPNFAE